MAKRKTTRMALTGNEAMAFAMKQINPDVVAAYPITPATQIVELFSKYVADGEVDTEFVPVESEHSAMSACVGASAAGARVMTGTASQGLALMHEILYIASSLRLPITMCVVNRTLSAPINIHCDHSDTMGSRDAGWIQIYTENVQEAYASTIVGVRTAEKANLPVMVTTDGFVLSHGMESLDVFDDEDVRKFLGQRKPLYNVLDVDNPITVGPLDLQDYFFEHKRGQIEAMFEAKKHIYDAHREFAEFFGVELPVFMEPYRLDDAEYAIVVLGSSAGTGKEVVDDLRDEKGMKVGLLRLRIFRPFPYEELQQVLGKVKYLAVMDRADSLNTMGGPVATEIARALYHLSERPIIHSFVYGLGGRDVPPENFYEVIEKMQWIAAGNTPDRMVTYVGVRE